MTKTIEAFKLMEDMGKWPEWMKLAFDRDAGEPGSLWPKYDEPPSGAVYFATPTGEVRVNVGDWIIRGMDGGLRCCQLADFDKAYENMLAKLMVNQ
jgi:hypothetical protein